MEKIKIITDSTNDLSPEILEAYDVTVVPLYVEFGEECYKDGIELTPKQLFEMVEDKGILPKTASPSPYDFACVYREYIEQGFDIVVITISSELSSTFQNAVLAATEFPGERIWIVDSRSLCTGIGLLVMTAGDYAREGMPARIIAEKVQQLTSSVNVSFVIDTLEYLYKGGRCNAVQNLLGSVLRIRPIIGLVDGRMIVKDKVRGDKQRALEKMAREAVDRAEAICANRVIVSYSEGGEAEANYLRLSLQQALPDVQIYTTTAGCVISSHCGPNTIGLMFIA